MGRPMDSQEALSAGLVNAVVAASEVETHAGKSAREIAAMPPEAVSASRRLMRGSPEDLVRRIDEEAELFKARLTSSEARTAFETFLLRKR
jgi:enoyl-CoA hydratase/carnithine racemase